MSSASFGEFTLDKQLAQLCLCLLIHSFIPFILDHAKSHKLLQIPSGQKQGKGAFQNVMIAVTGVVSLQCSCMVFLVLL